jgi:hypothetical protein
MAFATRSQLLAVEDVSQYETTIDITIELDRAQNSIIRLLNSTWWQQFLKKNPQYTPGQLRADLLLASEWREAVIYYALGFNILPKAQTLTAENLSGKMAEYHDKFNYVWRHLLEFGITYDVDGTTLRFVEENEHFDYIRLRK